MTRSDAKPETLTASECARRTGLTVKALRVYERMGLLTPMRTLKDWRVYDAQDLVRIGEVTALRSLGLKLIDIAELMKGQRSDIARMLVLQHDDLQQRKARVDDALAMIATLRRKSAAGETLTLQDLTTAIKESQMTTSPQDALAWKRYEQARPRTAIDVPMDALQKFVGYFQFASGSIMHMTIKESALWGQLQGQPALPMLAEAEDRFFSTDVLAQISFERNLAENVSALILHQNGFEQRAARIPQQAAKLAQVVLAARVAAEQPHPSSQKLVEAMILGQLKGEPCTTLMAPELAAAAVEQNQRITEDFKTLGTLEAVRFLTVTPEGWDAFRAQFERGELDVSIYVGRDGKIGGALYEAPKTERFWQQLRVKVYA